MRTIVVVDTNLILHFKPIEEIDWCQLLESEQVEILLTAVVLGELDKKKLDASSNKLRKRSEARIRAFRAFRTKPQLRENVRVVFDGKSPALDYSKHGLDPRMMDDVLIARIIELKQEFGDGVRLVTNDFGLDVKAHAKGISVVELPENLKLPEELNHFEGENKKLKEHIQSLTALFPRLKLAAPDGKQHLEFVASSPRLKTEAEITLYLEEVRRKFPRLVHSSEQLVRADDEALPGTENIARVLKAFKAQTAMLGESPLSEVQRYNKELEEYYSALQTHLNKAQPNYENMLARTLRLEFSLINEGSAPGTDIDLNLHFPDGFKLVSESDFPEPPSTPKLPRKPVSNLESIQRMMNPLGSSGMPYIPSPVHRLVDKPNVSDPDIKETNSYEVNLKILKLKQHNQELIGPFYATFPTLQGMKSFEVDYVINCENFPQNIAGKIHIVIKD